MSPCGDSSHGVAVPAASPGRGTAGAPSGAGWNSHCAGGLRPQGQAEAAEGARGRAEKGDEKMIETWSKEKKVYSMVYMVYNMMYIICIYVYACMYLCIYIYM